MSQIRGVILDVDGTLVDSNDAHAQAWVDALTEAGYIAPYEMVRPLIGMGGDKLLPAVIGVQIDTDEGQLLDERRGQIFKARYLPELSGFEGVPALLERLKRDGIRLVVASSAKAEELEHLLKIAQADGYIEKQTSSDDVDHSKPSPDVVHAALDRLGLPPLQTVMLGDTPYDVEAATRAQVPIIGLRCGGWREDQLEGAVAVYDDPADLLAHYDDSPLANGQNGSSLAWHDVA
ncbi:HAD family hydrolase [Aggregatilinea lenta]|uniref:HAD family hydrolase n=1 Tax=Aggregatilinea lenta TaxID=913108 RepID=UPI000E5BBCEC|nr:HAD family hydrolase [Aggregatilinea lenta]